MRTLTAILFLALGLPAQGAWVLDGITYNDCSGEYFATAIREGYCVEPPQLLEGRIYNVVLRRNANTFVLNSLIRVPTSEQTPGGSYKEVQSSTLDIVEFIETTPIGVWRVVNQANRQSWIWKTMSEDKCYMSLRGLWTGIIPNVGLKPNPLVDATFTYVSTVCLE